MFIGRDFSQTKSYSEKTAAAIDDEVKLIFDEANELCEEILTEHRDIVIAAADYLIEHETMDGEDFKYFCQHGGKMPPKQDNENKQSTSAGGSFPEVPDLTGFLKGKDESV